MSVNLIRAIGFLFLMTPIVCVLILIGYHSIAALIMTLATIAGLVMIHFGIFLMIFAQDFWK